MAARCVAQIGTAGMEALKPQIQEALGQVLRCEALLFKNDSAAREMEGLPSYVEAAKGSFDAPAAVIEDGLEFQAPLTAGQKTGWFFDQADNRRALSQVRAAGRPRLGCLQLCGRLGSARGAPRRARGHLRRQFRGRARFGGGERTAQWRRSC